MDMKLIFGILMMIICTTTGCVTDDEPKGEALQVGDSLPQFSVTMNTGETISSESLIGKVSVIVFFNTDCSDCRKELPEIQKLWEQVRENPEVIILPISREESAQDITKYWEANSLSLPWSAQENRDIYSLFAPSIIPRIFISDKNGVITASYGDTDMPDAPLLYQQIQKNLR